MESASAISADAALERFGTVDFRQYPTIGKINIKSAAARERNLIDFFKSSIRAKKDFFKCLKNKAMF